MWWRGVVWCAQVFRHGMMQCNEADIAHSCPHGAIRLEAGISWRAVNLSELVTEAHNEFLS